MSQALRVVALAAYACCFGGVISAQSPLNERVLVVYNADAPDSRAVAGYYAAKRSIPASNVCKIRTSSADSVGEDEYRSEIKRPVRKCLQELGLDKVLYIVFTYGTPYDVAMNGQTYAVDGFVADIWDDFLPDRPATQNEPQPYLGKAQSEGDIYQPYVPFSAFRDKAGAKRIYSVWRLDGPTAALAKGLVDKALFAEAHGLHGRACFDRRYGDLKNVSDYSYGAGDWDVFQAGVFARKAGFDVLEDAHEQEFGTAPAPLRCDNAALYAGWYTLNHYNDAFSWPPGAIGIHLDSASAQNPRGGPNWAANAIAHGITVTSGAVAEPYLENLPHPDQALLYLFQGANAGDALMRSIRLLKWRIINIGDPLYRPFPGGLQIKTPLGLEVVFGLAPEESLGDMQSGAVIGLNRPAPAAGVEFQVKCSRPDLLDVPQTVRLEAGQSHVLFKMTAKQVREDATPVRLFIEGKVPQAMLSKSNTLLLYPPLEGITLSASTAKTGSQMKATVTVRRLAPPEGMKITFTSSDPASVSIPREIEIPAGQSKAEFAVGVSSVKGEEAVVLTASYDGVARTATLTVKP